MANSSLQKPIFFKDNNTWSPVNLPPQDSIEDKLPPAIYEPVVVRTQEGIKLYFETKSLFTMPETIYGTTIADSGRIITSYKESKNNLGVLLSGTSGAGKSLLAKIICNIGVAELGLPVMIITEGALEHIKLIVETLSKRNQNAVFFFDEFDKITQTSKLSAEDAQRNQNSLLSILDGYLDTNNLYLFTANDIKYINQYFFNRPSRIRYHYKFNGLPQEVYTKMIEDKLVNRENVGVVSRIFFQVDNPSFDLLNEFITECNRFPDIDPEILIASFNITYSDRVLHNCYDISVNVNGLPFSEYIKSYLPADAVMTSLKFGTGVKLSELHRGFNYLDSKYNRFIDASVKSPQHSSLLDIMCDDLIKLEPLNDGGLYIVANMKTMHLDNFIGSLAKFNRTDTFDKVINDITSKIGNEVILEIKASLKQGASNHDRYHKPYEKPTGGIFGQY